MKSHDRFVISCSHLSLVAAPRCLPKSPRVLVRNLKPSGGAAIDPRRARAAPPPKGSSQAPRGGIEHFRTQRPTQQCPNELSLHSIPCFVERSSSSDATAVASPSAQLHAQSWLRSLSTAQISAEETQTPRRAGRNLCPETVGVAPPNHPEAAFILCAMASLRAGAGVAHARAVRLLNAAP